MDFIFLAGISGGVDYAIINWIGPALILVIAIRALVLLYKQEWRQAIGFFALAAVASVLVFAGATLFGKDGNITQLVTETAKQVNLITYDNVSAVNDLLAE